jgi:putative hydrolase of the HAD superfamily
MRRLDSLRASSAPAAVFFDAVHTLFDLHPSFAGAFSQICGDFGYRIELERFEAVMKPMLREVEQQARAADSHPCSHESLVAHWMEFNRRVFRGVGIDGDIEALAHEVERRFDSGQYAYVYPASFEVLERVRALGVVTGILSNGTLGMENCLRVLGLAERVDVVLVSAALGYEKPDAQVFRLAEEAVGFAASHCFLVGDNFWADVAGARRAGWRTAWYNPEGRALPEPAEMINRLEDFPALVERWVSTLPGPAGSKHRRRRTASPRREQ